MITEIDNTTPDRHKTNLMVSLIKQVSLARVPFLVHLYTAMHMYFQRKIKQAGYAWQPASELRKASRQGRLASVRNTTKFVHYVSQVVYCTPFTCGQTYIGQTGRCLNMCLRDDHISLKRPVCLSNLAMHCHNRA